MDESEQGSVTVRTRHAELGCEKNSGSGSVLL